MLGRKGVPNGGGRLDKIPTVLGGAAVTALQTTLTTATAVLPRGRPFRPVAINPRALAVVPLTLGCVRSASLHRRATQSGAKGITNCELQAILMAELPSSQIAAHVSQLTNYNCHICYTSGTTVN